MAATVKGVHLDTTKSGDLTNVQLPEGTTLRDFIALNHLSDTLSHRVNDSDGEQLDDFDLDDELPDGFTVVTSVAKIKGN